MRRIKHYHVSGQPTRQAAAIGEVHARRRRRCHLSNGITERERLALAHIATEHARKRADAPRVRTAGSRRSIDGEPAAVGTHHGKRMRENTVEILFAHREAEHAHTASAAPQQRGRVLVRIHAARHGVCAETRALGVTVFHGANG